MSESTYAALVGGTVIAVGLEPSTRGALRPFLIIRRRDGSQRTVSIADAQGDGAGRLSTVEGSDEATFDATRAISATVMAVDPHGPAIEIVAFPPGEPASPLGTVRLRVLAESDATPGSLVVRA